MNNNMKETYNTYKSVDMHAYYERKILIKHISLPRGDDVTCRALCPPRFTLALPDKTLM